MILDYRAQDTSDTQGDNGNIKKNRKYDHATKSGKDVKLNIK